MVFISRHLRVIKREWFKGTSINIKLFNQARNSYEDDMDTTVFHLLSSNIVYVFC